jgi:hypothetical protein
MIQWLIFGFVCLRLKLGREDFADDFYRDRFLNSILMRSSFDSPTSTHTKPALPATLRRGTFYIPMPLIQLNDWSLPLSGPARGWAK